MLAAILCNLNAGASSHDGWLRHHYRRRHREKEFARLAAELKELHSKAKPSAEVEKVIAPFVQGDQIKWLTLAKDAGAIERLLDGLDSQRSLHAKQQADFHDAEALFVLEMSDHYDRELVSQSLQALAEVLH